MGVRAGIVRPRHKARPINEGSIKQDEILIRDEKILELSETINELTIKICLFEEIIKSFSNMTLINRIKFLFKWRKDKNDINK